MKIAIVGAGISGLSCAYRLSRAGYDVSLFESNDYFGGHTHTVDVTLEGKTWGVDTGFLVFNHKTYPNLVQMFEELDVQTVSTDMSFSVKMPVDSLFGKRSLEWAGADLDTVFAQRRNLLNPRFVRMLRDILRFNKQSTALANQAQEVDPAISLGDFLNRNGYSEEFRSWYLLPMAGCIWSCPTAQMLAFPASTFIRFCHNHGLLQVSDRPRWHTVLGGARHYVDKLLLGIGHKVMNSPVRSVTRVPMNVGTRIRIETDRETHLADHVVMACHSDETLRLLPDATPDERRLLGAVNYQPNRAILHTDDRFLPANRKAWSAWNYQSESGKEPRVCCHYLINKLQPLPFDTPVLVSLNPIEEPDPSRVLQRFDYAHPVFDAGAVASQKQLPGIQGLQNTWFAGAWTGYGFHEDGLKSGLAAAQAIASQQDCETSEILTGQAA